MNWSKGEGSKMRAEEDRARCKKKEGEGKKTKRGFGIEQGGATFRDGGENGRIKERKWEVVPDVHSC